MPDEKTQCFGNISQDMSHMYINIYDSSLFISLCLNFPIYINQSPSSVV